MQLAEAKDRLSIPLLWARLQLPGTPKKSCRCPWRQDRHPSFSVFANGTKWKDHGTGENGDAVDFFQQATGLSQGDACRQFLALATCGSPPPRWRSRPDGRPAVLAPPPLLSQGTPGDWLTLSRTRSVSVEAVKLATERGLLRFGTFRNRPVWFVTDSSRRVIQARRLDSDRWWPHGPKALTLAGGQASWPVGAADMGQFSRIIMVEGGPDLLAAFHFIFRAGCGPTFTAVAMLGAANNIHADAINLFAGKATKIVPHLDPPDKNGRRAGMDAARRWQTQLQGAGAAAEIISLRDLVPEAAALKDLNDVTQLPITQQMVIAKRLTEDLGEKQPP